MWGWGWRGASVLVQAPALDIAAADHLTFVWSSAVKVMPILRTVCACIVEAPEALCAAVLPCPGELGVLTEPRVLTPALGPTRMSLPCNKYLGSVTARMTALFTGFTHSGKIQICSPVYGFTNSCLQKKLH